MKETIEKYRNLMHKKELDQYEPINLEILYRQAEARGREKGNDDCACREEQEHFSYVIKIVIAIVISFGIGLWIG